MALVLIAENTSFKISENTLAAIKLCYMDSFESYYMQTSCWRQNSLRAIGVLLSHEFAL